MLDLTPTETQLLILQLAEKHCEARGHYSFARFCSERSRSIRAGRDPWTGKEIKAC